MNTSYYPRFFKEIQGPSMWRTTVIGKGMNAYYITIEKRSMGWTDVWQVELINNYTGAKQRYLGSFDLLKDAKTHVRAMFF